MRDRLERLPNLIFDDKRSRSFVILFRGPFFHDLQEGDEAYDPSFCIHNRYLPYIMIYHIPDHIINVILLEGGDYMGNHNFARCLRGQKPEEIAHS